MIVPAALAELERFHRAPIERLFGPNPPRDGIDPSLNFLFVCFTNRCGSNYLAHLMGSTGMLNVAEEVFNAPTVQEHAEREGLRSLHEYIGFLDRHLSVRGWLAAKLGIEQLVMLTEAGIFDEIIGRTKFILIERRDTVAQAISRLVALQNGAWTSGHAAKMADEQLVYAREAIDAERAIISFHNQAFYRFFASNNLSAKHIAYETLLEQPERLLAEIGAWLGFPRFIGRLAAVGIERQESPIKRAWRERYQRGA